MPLVVKNKGNESPLQIVKRFITAVRRSGIYRQVKEHMYYQRPLSRKKKIEKRVRAERILAEKRRLEKWGKI